MDDVTLPGSGAKIATEDIGGSHYQKMILADKDGKIFDPDDMIDLLTRLTAFMRYPVYYDRSLNKIKADISGTVAVSSATVTNVSQIDTYPAKLAVVGINTTAWALSCRNLIT